MKKHRILSILLIFTILCAVITLGACGSKSEEKPLNGVMTAVTDENGTVIGYERRFRNDDGNITRLDSYDAQQNYMSFVLYAYDDAGRLFTETYYTADGIGRSRTVYSYDDSGRVVEKAFEEPHGEVTVERYDADGAVVEKLYYGTDEQLIYREVLENGAWVRYDATEPSESD